MSAEPGVPVERLHALDAVRNYALLLGVVLHACAGFLQGFPMPPWTLDAALGPALIYYAIHVFRMSAFYLMVRLLRTPAAGEARRAGFRGRPGRADRAAAGAGAALRPGEHRPVHAA